MDRGEAGKRTVSVTDVQILRIREPAVVGRGPRRKRHDSERIRHLERTQEEGVGQAENRGVGADRQSDRDNRRKCESRTAPSVRIA